jgi:hypothetical protein
MQILESEASVTPKRTWCFWSTTETIQNEVPCVTAILETLIAVPLYWWIALRIGVIQPLLVSVLIAPLVLLRSEESVALGVRWCLRLEKNSEKDVQYKNASSTHRRCFWAITALSAAAAIAVTWLIIQHLLSEDWQIEPKIGVIVVAFALISVIIFSANSIASVFLFQKIPTTMSMFQNLLERLTEGSLSSVLFGLMWLPGRVLAVLVITIGIRIAATLAYLRAGVEALPTNFRRVILCTSPAQIPEIVPGIDKTDSSFKFSKYLGFSTGFDNFGDSIYSIIVVVLGFMLYFPAWFYRLTIKSTAWFWWPLAFLGGDLRKARNPALIEWDVMGSLWAKTSIFLASASLLTFAVINLALDGAVFQRNPLLTPLGYLLLVDWTLRPWQVCALVGSVLSIVLVFLVNDVSGKYRIAQEAHDTGLIRTAERNFGWIERLARLRLLFVIVFWCLVGAHATLYVNSTRCWFLLPPGADSWAKDIYGDRLPPDNCSEPRGIGNRSGLGADAPG